MNCSFTHTKQTLVSFRAASRFSDSLGGHFPSCRVTLAGSLASLDVKLGYLLNCVQSLCHVKRTTIAELGAKLTVSLFVVYVKLS